MNYELRIKKRATGGFSLLELLIYVVLIAGLTMIIASTVVILNRSRGATEARAEVNTNLRFAIEKIAQDMQTATAVTTPSSTTTPTANTLVVTVSGSPVTYDVAGGVLRRNGEQITASTTLFTTPTFTRRENKNYTLNRSMVTIKVNLSASYNDTRPDWQYSATKETAIDMRMQ
jgi:type II secretory pathway pseudopilin PulG